MTEDAQRWVIVDAPELAPAVDFITRTPNGPFIDTGLNVTFDMRGRMYLSVETIEEMARVAGLLEKKTTTGQHLHEKTIYNEGYKDGLKDAGDLSGKLDLILPRIADAISTGDSDANSVENTEEPAAVSGNVRKSAAGSRSTGRTTGTTNSKSGPNDVPSIEHDAERFRI